jgi:hypothetical protein
VVTENEFCGSLGGVVVGMSIKDMDFSLEGYLDTLDYDPRKDDPLIPIYEAIMNGLEACQEANCSKPTVKVTVQRAYNEQPLKGIPKTKLAPIEEFVIEDNGIGFTQSNQDNFKAINKTHKLNHKGIGRTLWLKPFTEVEIQSVYKKGRSREKVRFTFKNSNQDSIVNLESSCVDIESTGSKVILKNIKDTYIKRYSKSFENITNSIKAQFLPYLLAHKNVKIVVVDSGEQEVLEAKGIQTKESVFVLKEVSFRVVNIKIDTDYFKRKHNTAYCAGGRVVRRETIKKINNEIVTKDGKFWYQCFVLSEFLDRNVTQLRNDFKIRKDLSDSWEDSEDDDGDITWNQIQEGVEAKQREFMEPFKGYLEGLRQETLRSAFSKRPYYDYLKLDDQFLQAIPYDAPLSFVESKLRDKHAELEDTTLSNLDNEIPLFIRKLKDGELEENYKERIDGYLSSLSDVAKSNLCHYICSRKVVLEQLDKFIALRQQDGKFKVEAENYIHNLIYPMKKDSDQVSYADHNLWVIDERLAFSRYIASDLTMNSNKLFKVQDEDNRKRLDICLFKENLFSSLNDREPYTDIIVIEIKKAHEPYNDIHDQLLDYAEIIRKGEMYNDKGNKVSVSPSNCRIFMYGVCNLTKEFASKLSSRHDYYVLPEWDRAIYYSKNLNVYIEIIDYSKLTHEAKMNNKVFFEKLSLHD